MNGLINAAAQGRNGDTRMAHVTPGEVIIPKEVAALRPDLVAHVGNAIRGMGGNPSQTIVGGGRINPKTGIEEFASAEEVTAAYQTYLGRAPENQDVINNWVSGSAGKSGGDFADMFLQAAAPETASRPVATPATPATPAAPAAPNINDIYQSAFGRPAAQAGLDYWAGVANNSPGIDLNAAIRGGAQSDDQAAMSYRTANANANTGWSNDFGAGNVAGLNNVDFNANTGVWENRITTPAYTPDTTSAAAVNANNAFTGETQTERMAIDPATMTVEGRIAGLIDANSPLMQRAAQSGLDLANQRGLLNSGMAIGSAQNAVLGQAVPIATSDAGYYNAAATNNMTQANQFMGQVAGLAANTANTNSQLALNANTAANAEAGAMARLTASEAAAMARLVAGEESAMDRAILAEASASGRATASDQAVMDRLLLSEAGASERSASGTAAQTAFAAEYYNTTLNQIATDNASIINSINAQLIDQAAKDAQIFAANSTAYNRRVTANSVAAALPGWNSDWLVIPAAPVASTSTTTDTAAP